FVDVDRALAGDSEAATAIEHGLDVASRPQQVILARPERDRHPAPPHDLVPGAGAHVLLARSEEEDARLRRQRRDQGERVEPAPGGTFAFGTSTSTIRAARAARRPLAESSTTRQRAGSTPSRRAASR